MGKLIVQTQDEPKGPVYVLDGNVLTIRAESEKEFLEGYEEHFISLMASEQRRVVVDFARSEGLRDEAFRMVALCMFEIGNAGKDITIRIPDNLERLFRHANLYRVATIEVVRLLGKQSKDEDGEKSDKSASGAHSAVSGSVSAAAKEASVVAPAAGATGPSASSVSHAPASQPPKPAEAPSARSAAAPGPTPAAAGAPASATTSGADLKNALQERFEAERRAREAGLTQSSAGGSLAGLGTAVGPDGRKYRGRLVDRRTGQIVDITKYPTQIGRVPGNDILIAMPLVSKRHARILFEGGAFFIEDLGSANGTFVNGERIVGKKDLLDGARIQIAITTQYPNGAKEYTFRAEEVT